MENSDNLCYTGEQESEDPGMGAYGYVAVLCLWFGPVFRADVDPGQMRHPKDGSYGGYGDPDSRSAVFLVADGLCVGLPGYYLPAICPDLAVPHPVRPGYGGVLALLFPCPSAGGREQGGAH